MISVKKTSISIALICMQLFAIAQQHAITKEQFDILNLGYPGLEKVQKEVNAGRFDNAAFQLLQYFRHRSNIKNAPYAPASHGQYVGKSIGASDKQKADNALIHHFQPQKGYKFYDYGRNIDWQYWPVKDNEVRWQLHRVYWWQSMGKAYLYSRDEKYAKEWVFQFRDWARKNPLGLSADNDRFAWRPLEVSERVQSLPATFNMFITSPSFTPSFLVEFLNSYNQQADYITQHYSDRGNHLLFEAQRVVGAGAFFPEMKNAAAWRKSGIEVLNNEIKKQVYPDGVQWELSPAYHVASINIFLKAYASAQQAGIEKEFPENYKKTIENMVMAAINFSFPDYNNPMFGDSWLVNKSERIKQFVEWTQVFPQNKVIKYFATEGKEGKKPEWLSKALAIAGFYTFRNGWTNNATVMILKASPPGEFHAQPDNGTFELWVKGRNFTPDAGCFVYSGDSVIMKQRDWYRQTRVHNTLTLDNKNMVITKAKLNKWQVGKTLDLLTYTNPSYGNLDHQRSILFIDQTYFLIIDKMAGHDKGILGTHFVLKEDSSPEFDKESNKVYTTYTDGNNLLIQNLNSDKVSLNSEPGKVSYEYMKEIQRPAFVFEKNKNNSNEQIFITLVYPYHGHTAPKIGFKENPGNDYTTSILDFTLTINGIEKRINQHLTDQ